MFGGFTKLFQSKQVPALDDEQRAFLRFITSKVESAYPSIGVTPSRDGSFGLHLKMKDATEQGITASLQNIFVQYSNADTDTVRQRLLEHFLSALGNTAIGGGVQISPDQLILQLLPASSIGQGADIVCVPFLGDLVAVLMCVHDTRIKPVKNAFLEVLAISLEDSLTQAITNTPVLIEEISHHVETDWPGLIFTGTSSDLATALIFKDFVVGDTLPDGAYFIHQQGRYVYAPLEDKTIMATLEVFRTDRFFSSDEPVSGSLLVREKGVWRLESILSSADAA